MNKKLKLFILVALITLLAFVLLFFRNTQKTGVVIDTSPKQTIVTINGKDFPSGYIALSPGTYMIKVDHSAFLSEQRTITVKKSSVETITVFLNPDGVKGSKWMAEHPEEQTRRESEGSRVVDTLISQQVTNQPLISELPHADNLYVVSYAASKKYPSDGTKTALLVRYFSVEGLAQANEWLTFKGVSIDKTEIIYIDGVAEGE